MKVSQILAVRLQHAFRIDDDGVPILQRLVDRSFKGRVLPWLLWNGDPTQQPDQPPDDRQFQVGLEGDIVGPARIDHPPHKGAVQPMDMVADHDSAAFWQRTNMLPADKAGAKPDGMHRPENQKNQAAQQPRKQPPEKSPAKVRKLLIKAQRDSAPAVKIGSFYRQAPSSMACCIICSNRVTQRSSE